MEAMTDFLVYRPNPSLPTVGSVTCNGCGKELVFQSAKALEIARLVVNIKCAACLGIPRKIVSPGKVGKPTVIKDGKKPCRMCKGVLPLEQFTKTSRGYYFSYCKKCYGKYHKEHTKTRRLQP
jgi:hypothetical protein